MPATPTSEGIPVPPAERCAAIRSSEPPPPAETVRPWARALAILSRLPISVVGRVDHVDRPEVLRRRRPLNPVAGRHLPRLLQRRHLAAVEVGDTLVEMRARRDVLRAPQRRLFLVGQP